MRGGGAPLDITAAQLMALSTSRYRFMYPTPVFVVRAAFLVRVSVHDLSCFKTRELQLNLESSLDSDSSISPLQFQPRSLIYYSAVTSKQVVRAVLYRAKRIDANRPNMADLEQSRVECLAPSRYILGTLEACPRWRLTELSAFSMGLSDYDLS